MDLEGPSASAAPSANELRLGRRVAELENDKVALLAEIDRLNDTNGAKPGQHPRRHISSPQALLTIPNDLLPTLTLLRSHITTLTRDNEALRYTFMGTKLSSGRHLSSVYPQAIASSSKITLDTPMTPAPTSDGQTNESPAKSDRLELITALPECDLQSVVERVKELIKENDELGEMLLEAGRSGGHQWEKLVDDYRSVIDSLESDLAHHASLVDSLRTEVDGLKDQLVTRKSQQDQGSPSVAGSARNEDAVDKRRSTARPSHGNSRNHGSRPNKPVSPYHTNNSDQNIDLSNTRGQSHGTSWRVDHRHSDYHSSSGRHVGSEGVNSRDGRSRDERRGHRDAKKEDDRAWKRRR